MKQRGYQQSFELAHKLSKRPAVLERWIDGRGTHEKSNAQVCTTERIHNVPHSLRKLFLRLWAVEDNQTTDVAHDD